MVTDDAESPKKDGLGLSTTQLVAGAAATITVSIISSYWGVAGTLAGAGIMSVVSSVASAVYKFGMEVTHSRIRGRVSSMDRLRLHLPHWTPKQWGLAALVPVGLFGGTMVVLTGAEAAAGKPVSAIIQGKPGHGTSLGGGGVGTPSPAPSATVSTAPTDAPTGTATPGSISPSTTPTSVPSGTPTPIPSSTPTSVPSPLTTAEPPPGATDAPVH